MLICYGQLLFEQMCKGMGATVQQQKLGMLKMTCSTLCTRLRDMHSLHWAQVPVADHVNGNALSQAYPHQASCVRFTAQLGRSVGPLASCKLHSSKTSLSRPLFQLLLCAAPVSSKLLIPWLCSMCIQIRKQDLIYDSANCSNS